MKRPDPSKKKAAVSRKKARKPTGKKTSDKPVSASPPIGSERFFERDESWMLFNRRVLEEADDTTNPLLERVKYLAITASNLDEFIEIRVASLLQRIEDAYDDPRKPLQDGISPQQSLDRLAPILHKFVDAQYACWNQRLTPALREEGIRLLSWKELDDRAREHALRFYESEVDPLLTPVTVDPSHPFPRVLNKALCIALLLRSKRNVPIDQIMDADRQTVLATEDQEAVARQFERHGLMAAPVVVSGDD